jgi:hypothetical protein
MAISITHATICSSDSQILKLLDCLIPANRTFFYF